MLMTLKVCASFFGKLLLVFFNILILFYCRICLFTDCVSTEGYAIFSVRPPPL